MLRVELPNDIHRLDQQIYALDWQIRHNTNRKDAVIHKQALKELKEHREQLKAGD